MDKVNEIQKRETHGSVDSEDDGEFICIYLGLEDDLDQESIDSDDKNLPGIKKKWHKKLNPPQITLTTVSNKGDSKVKIKKGSRNFNNLLHYRIKTI